MYISSVNNSCRTKQTLHIEFRPSVSYTLLRPSGRKYDIRMIIYSFVMHFDLSLLGMDFIRLSGLLGRRIWAFPLSFLEGCQFKRVHLLGPFGAGFGHLTRWHRGVRAPILLRYVIRITFS